MQPLIEIQIGGQWLKLVFDASSGNTAVLVKEMHACDPENFTPCYSFDKSKQAGTATVCEENRKIDCDSGQGLKYPCNVPLQVDNLTEVPAKGDQLLIDGIQYNLKGVEGTDTVALKVKDTTTSGKEPVFPRMPIRFLVSPMTVPARDHGHKIPLPLFNQTNGIFGASGPSLSCRNGSVFGAFLQSRKVGLIIFDLAAPPTSLQYKRDRSHQSRIYFDNRINSKYAKTLVWSQPKQSGDVLNDGMYEFLLYRPKVCGIDLLYNTSSNWLAVIDTSGPCMALPSFLFDRFRSRVPLNCPFKVGEPSFGRLCSPDRGGSSKNKLPALSFELDDAQEQALPRLTLPLERLVFKSEADNGEEKLCVARADSEAVRSTTDLMFAHIAFGSLAVAAFYMVVNLDNRTTGLASKAKVSSETSDDLCIESVKCISTMQTYFPPMNLCEDPPCSDYIFMRLDESSKMCFWSPVVPVCFGILLAALVVLDLVSHRLYKQAIQKASEYNQ